MALTRARHVRSVPALLSAFALALTVSACSASADDDHGAGHRPAAGDAQDQLAAGPDDSADQGHDDGGDHPHPEGHEDHEHGHSSPTELTAMLVTAGQLPAGYQAGHAHAAETGAPPALDPACRPIAELVGAHPSVRQAEHPEAERVFSKSHFGPTVTEVVIDYGEAEDATEAVERLAGAAEECERYEHSTSRIGARSYTVLPGPEVADHPGGQSVRLEAVGADFRGIGWDVWWVQHGARVLAVSFRTAPGGDDAELTDAVRAAVAAMDAADS